MIEEKERKVEWREREIIIGTMVIYIYIFLGDCASYLRSLFIKKDHSRESLRTE